MKKTLLTALIAICSLISSAQLTFDFGVMDQVNTTWLLNQNIMDDGAAQDFAFSYANGFGINATMYFAENTGLEINVMSSKFKQNYIGEYWGVDYTSNVTIQSLDVPILLKFGKDAFFELGAMVSSYRGAQYTFNGVIDHSESVSGEFKSMNVSAMMGFGGNIKLDDHFRIYIAMRMGYGITDIEGVDALGRDLGNKNDITIYNDLVYPDYKPTNTAFAGLAVGLIYHLNE